jgi:hypothetical protein
MSDDNLSPHTDALATLGTIHTQQEYRDAIHLGVEPVTAYGKILPGDHLRWQDQERRSVERCVPLLGDEGAIGIADPFLFAPIMDGEPFWLVVYPRQITSLRHVWEHPNFPPSQETGAA